MCAQFEIEQEMFIKKLNKLNLQITDFNIPKKVLPYTKIPILNKNDENYILKEMNFSLIPYWSKERQPKFATHNARIETILEKPTWKNLFGKKHCLIPMTSFIEPIYEGDYAGNMVKFSIPECTFVPGLFDTWVDKVTGECIDSFTILTTEPGPIIQNIGHDRSPIFLDQDSIYHWLEIENYSKNQFFKFLENTIEFDFSISIDRKLKSKN